jgi:SAM-dependent methyltransferase
MSDGVHGSRYEDYLRANLANWDDRVPIHRASTDYSADRFIDDPSHLSGVVAFDSARLGDVRGKKLLHLQCHFGRDTLSWASLGAEVTGIDFSGPAIEEARRLSEASGVPGRFIVSDVYEAPTRLPEQFDIVYTGVGALCWLPDIRRWAEVVDAFLCPGGTFYIREGHPVLWALDYERPDDLLVLTLPYFETEEPTREEDEKTYTDGEATLANPVTYGWNHGLGEIISALVEVGLVITGLEEHRTVEWQALPFMVKGDDGLWRLPSGEDRLPLMYTVTATKPGGR